MSRVFKELEITGKKKKKKRKENKISLKKVNCQLIAVF